MAAPSASQTMTKPAPAKPQGAAAPRPMVVSTPGPGGPKAGTFAAAPKAVARGAADPNGPPVPGKLRPVSIGKAVGLTIVTFGIYYLVRTYKISGDLHRAPGGSGAWQVLYWTGVFLWIPMIVLFFLNNRQANNLAQAKGLSPSWAPFILYILMFTSIVSPFVWASHYNKVARA